MPGQAGADELVIVIRLLVNAKSAYAGKRSNATIDDQNETCLTIRPLSGILGAKPLKTSAEKANCWHVT